MSAGCRRRAARRARTGLCVGLLVAACAADATPTPRAPAPPEAPRAAAPAPSVPAAPRGGAPATLPAAARVVAFGDVHGDLDAALAALRLAGVVDEAGAWNGGATVVVQVGDQLDRGDQEEAILERFEALHVEAAAAGGAFWSLLGNHELMNVAGDLRYVTPGGFADFAAHGAGVAPPPGVDADQVGRVVAFQPGGPWARALAAHPVALQVGDTVFVHGGLTPAMASYGLQRLNDEASSWLRGLGRSPGWVRGEDSPVWLRAYSDDQVGADDCALAAEALATLGARRMVVGHTVQRGGPNAVCDGQVWRVDVGMARHYGGRPAVIVLEGDAVRVVGG